MHARILLLFPFLDWPSPHLFFKCDAIIIRSGLKEYIGANPALASVSSTTIVHSKSSDFSENSEYEVAEGADEFYDATDDSSSSEDEDNDNDDKNNQVEVNKVWFIGRHKTLCYYCLNFTSLLFSCFMSGYEDKTQKYFLGHNKFSFKKGFRYFYDGISFHKLGCFCLV